MTESFRYEGGPRDQETSQANEVDFPEIHPGGEYRWSGTPQDQLGGEPATRPDADRAVAVWHPRDTS
ncbi:hypothetical protein AB6813_12790 [bacterium RCC_150]